MADTFDILLFKTKAFASKITQIFTSSEFDHAAMVVKMGSEPDDLFFMEATND